MREQKQSPSAQPLQVRRADAKASRLQALQQRAPSERQELEPAQATAMRQRSYLLQRALGAADSIGPPTWWRALLCQVSEIGLPPASPR